jgi:ADP-ribose pyrophosphatase YjhB (NUDIX family)
VILTNHNEETEDKKKEKLLFCKRAKPPYMGLLNFVGGKLEPGESSEAAAYRELFEETGISRSDIELHRLMDMTYYQQKLVLVRWRHTFSISRRSPKITWISTRCRSKHGHRLERAEEEPSTTL